MDPRGKVALVTGSIARVGRAMSLGLAEVGVHVIVHYNRCAGSAEETVAEARQLGVRRRAYRQTSLILGLLWSYCGWQRTALGK